MIRVFHDNSGRNFMNLTKIQRETLRMKFGGRCAYCGCELPERGWHADHVEPVLREWWKNTAGWKESHSFKWEVNEATGRFNKIAIPLEKAGLERPHNDTLDNLFPACRECNIDKHASTLEHWRKAIEDKVGVCRRNYTAFRHAERFGLVKDLTKPVIFWFEQYEVEK